MTAAPGRVGPDAAGRYTYYRLRVDAVRALADTLCGLAAGAEDAGRGPACD